MWNKECVALYCIIIHLKIVEISQEREKISRKQRASKYSSEATGFMLGLRDLTESLTERSKNN